MKKTIIISIFLLSVALNSCQSDKPKVDTDKYLDFAVQQAEKTLEAQSDVQRMPRHIKPGDEAWSTTGITGWTSGFWPGSLWYLYEYSGDEELREAAFKWNNPLKELTEWTNINHDIGFMVFCSLGNGYRLTGDQEYKEVILEMAEKLATLYNPNAGTILSWPGRTSIGNIEVSGTMNHNTIIDNMMNLELLFWASENGGGEELYDIAEQHAITTMENQLRPDYSSYHVVIYDSLTGEVGHRIQHQGYLDETMWARGQAWGIYGFTVAYRETGKHEFLETAKNMAQVYIDNLPEDHVPYWDFEAPGIPDEEKDASAAAITASALLELSTLVEDNDEKIWYRENAFRMLKSLGENYLSDGSNHAVLWHSVGNKNRDSEVDVPIIYADYYFIEALIRARKLQ